MLLHFHVKESDLLEGPEIKSAEAVIDNGSYGTRTIRFEAGRLAQQAQGSVAAYLDEDTMLLSATSIRQAAEGQFDFFPLTVDVEERSYAAGKIPGSFFRREGRPSTEAILVCRLIDRPLRPSFVNGLRNEVQIVITVLSIAPGRVLRRPRDQRGQRLEPDLRRAVLRPDRRRAPRAHRRASGSRSRPFAQLEDAVFDLTVAGRCHRDAARTSRS